MNNHIAATQKYAPLHIGFGVAYGIQVYTQDDAPLLRVIGGETDEEQEQIGRMVASRVNAHEQLVEALRTLYWSSLVFVGVAPEHMAYEEDDPSYQRERAKVISAIARAEAALELAQKGTK